MTRNLVSERRAMLAGMKPTLKIGRHFFCTTDDREVLTALSDRSLAAFKEDEGTALVLTEEDAMRHGFDVSMRLRQTNVAGGAGG